MCEKYPALRYTQEMWDDCKNGVWTVECPSWKEYVRTVEEYREYRYVWRGQSSEKPLLPSIYRDKEPKRHEIDQHLLHFRRNLPTGGALAEFLERAQEESRPEFTKALSQYRNMIHPHEVDIDPTNDVEDFIAYVYWAIGQHYGLETPILDWTHDPYTALFFAFCKKKEKHSNRVVFGLAEKSRRLLQKRGATKRYVEFLDALYFVETLSNADGIPQDIRKGVRAMFCRIKAQKGLFTRTLYKESIEQYARKCYREHREKEGEIVFLIKIVIPDDIREDVLRELEEKGISYKAVYPDVQGAALHANLKLERSP